MARFRLVLLSMLAAFAVSAVVSASASALPALKCGTGTAKGEWVYCVEGTEIADGTTKGIEGSLTNTAKLGTVVAGTAIKIECTVGTVIASNSVVEDSGASKGEIQFSTCTVVGVEHCFVKEPIVVKFTDQLVGTVEAGLAEDEFKPANGLDTGEFTTITLKGTECSITGTKLPVTGTQNCKLPGAETEAASHTIECLPGGSNLDISGNETKEAEFTGTFTVKLSATPTKLWSVRDSTD